MVTLLEIFGSFWTTVEGFWRLFVDLWGLSVDVRGVTAVNHVNEN